MDEEIETSATAPAVDEKDATAREIYTTWRNAHLNNLPVELFNRLEAESEQLIAAIRAHL